MTKPLSRSELEILRRSVGASGQLAPDQLLRLIGEAERLVIEREQVASLVRELQGPWPELRRVLNELQRLVDAAGHSLTNPARPTQDQA